MCEYYKGLPYTKHKELKEDFVASLRLFKRLGEVMPKIDGLSHSESMLLRHMFIISRSKSKDEPLTVSDVKTSAGVTKPAISQALSALESKGYVSRAIGLPDRRLVSISITDKGERALIKCFDQINVFLDELIGRLGEENFKSAVKLFMQISEIAEQIKSENML